MNAEAILKPKRSGGRASRAKGSRRELQIVERIKATGTPAAKVPLSGGAGGLWSGDVRFWPEGEAGPELRAEVKARASGEGFKTLEAWLGDNDALFLVRDRAPPLAVLPWATFAGLLGLSIKAAREAAALEEGARHG